MPGAGKQGFPGSYGEESPTKPGKAPLTPQQHQLPGIPDISIFLWDIGMIQVPPAKPEHCSSWAVSTASDSRGEKVG